MRARGHCVCAGKLSAEKINLTAVRLRFVVVNSSLLGCNLYYLCKPFWPSGKELGWQAEGPRFESASALLSLQQLWSADTVL